MALGLFTQFRSACLLSFTVFSSRQTPREEKSGEEKKTGTPLARFFKNAIKRTPPPTERQHRHVLTPRRQAHQPRFGTAVWRKNPPLHPLPHRTPTQTQRQHTRINPKKTTSASIRYCSLAKEPPPSPTERQHRHVLTPRRHISLDPNPTQTRINPKNTDTSASIQTPTQTRINPKNTDTSASISTAVWRKNPPPLPTERQHRHVLTPRRHISLDPVLKSGERTPPLPPQNANTDTTPTQTRINPKNTDTSASIRNCSLAKEPPPSPTERQHRHVLTPRTQAHQPRSGTEVWRKNPPLPPQNAHRHVLTPEHRHISLDSELQSGERTPTERQHRHVLTPRTQAHQPRSGTEVWRKNPPLPPQNAQHRHVLTPRTQTHQPRFGTAVWRKNPIERQHRHVLNPENAGTSASIQYCSLAKEKKKK
ncbi:hypothetical protein C7M84_025080 [Penaeus vannamei]|uniref:Uncharacterized protein n=1 Tax=Penaeus vannamei TaxID=6689 RepID=A0A3R7QKI6_PENVA|nr:hypothetical protein C7M84_025080 [Penaeus vannamei]